MIHDVLDDGASVVVGTEVQIRKRVGSKQYPCITNKFLSLRRSWIRGELCENETLKYTL
jgi:hypothetical protein